jgi:hypothetical protein
LLECATSIHDSQFTIIHNSQCAIMLNAQISERCEHSVLPWAFEDQSFLARS